MKISLFFVFLTVFFTQSAWTMGPPTIDLGIDLDPSDYLNTASIVGPSVDQFQKQTALTEVRSIVNQDKIDKCFSDEEAHDLFSEQISYYAAMMFKDVPAMVGFIGSSFGTSEDDQSYFPTSLIRHPLCQVSSSTLSKTLKKNIPSQAVIDKINHFSITVNNLRSQVINGDISAKKELLNSWSRMFSCLAYTESLSAPDTKSSVNAAIKYSPEGYRKPAGVQFYEDPSQPAESKLNIGTFQFTPNSKSGNIIPCIKAWNIVHAKKPACMIALKDTQANDIKIVGSSLQSFNAFCGVHKLIQTFAIQVNTKNTSATHPNNIISGNLKASEARCVSPNFYWGKAYGHFGPFMNSTGSNMNQLYSCLEKSAN
ncbi:MAG: hypothetical protein Q7U04_14445 [Bacteriovorax sp.]|nr:hypothetical protein [Bacteriovorax sp.]